MSATQEPGSSIQVEGYSIKSRLGTGGFATVFRATQDSLQRDIALKIMSPEQTADYEFRERFLLEGMTVARLSDHQSIVTIFDIGECNGHYFMAMELLSGGTLEDKLTSPLTPRAAERIFLQIGDALAHAHKQGFVHRDIKPANVLFHNNGVAMLSDFGIAKQLDSNKQLTQVGFAIGTPTYMSPEQAAALDLDGRSDIYSLGIMLYEMLVGTPPFTGKDGLSIALKHLNEAAPRLPEDLSRYQSFLDKILAKKPEDRYGTIAEAISALPAHVAAPTPKAQNKKGATVVLGGVLTALIAVAAWVIYQMQTPAEITTSPSPIKTAPAVLSPTQQEKVDRLLSVASSHASIGRWRAPTGSNALETYQLVLEIDPTNQAALEAVGTINAMPTE
mgnify:CR=1 FL=1